MADAELTSGAVRGRVIATTDHALGLDPAQPDAADAAKTDTWAATFLTLLRAFPAALTATERETIRSALVSRQTLASAAAVAWNVDAGSVADLTLTGAVTVSLSGGVDGTAALLRVVQDGAGGRALTLSSRIGMGGRQAPAIAPGANERTYLFFHRVGAVWTYIGVIADE